jgi:hypothetical protein
MATERQVQANRLNAQRSTGPATATGKDASRLNALKHGLTARHHILPTETEEEFEEFVAAFMDALRPKGVFERMLTERLAAIAWRLRRVPQFETAYLKWLSTKDESASEFDKDMSMGCFQTPSSGNTEDDRFGRVVEMLLTNTDVLGKLQRYEKSLSSEFTKLLNELGQFQEARLKNAELEVVAPKTLSAGPSC